MFVWELWHEIMESGMEMAAKSALSSVSIDHGVKAEAEAYGPISHRTDAIFAEYELFQKMGEMTACFIDDKARAHDFSPNWQEMVGLSPYQCYSDKFDHFFHPQHRPFIREKIRTLLLQCEAKASYRESIRFRAQYGSTHSVYTWYEFTMSPHRVEGKEVFIAVLMRKITREIETERSLRVAQIKADMATQNRAQFLSHMSHELRTPLNAVLGFAEMMEKGIHGEFDQEVYKDYLSNIRESGHMLLSRINDMLEISSIETGGTALVETQFKPETLLKDAVAQHKAEISCRSLGVTLPREYPKVMITGDRKKLARVLGNILSNAIRFSIPKSEILFDCQLVDNQRLRIMVKDFGEGMSGSLLKSLRETMAKPHCLFACNPDSVGLGLGLAVAKEYSRMHEATLELNSRKDVGTQVVLTIPTDRVQLVTGKSKKKAAIPATNTLKTLAS